MTKSGHIRQRALDYIKENNNIQIINTRNRSLVRYMCSVSLTSVLRWLQTEDMTGSFLAVRERKLNAESFAMRQDHFDFIVECLEEEPALFGEEMSGILDDKFHIVSLLSETNVS